MKHLKDFEMIEAINNSSSITKMDVKCEIGKLLIIDITDNNIDYSSSFGEVNSIEGKNNQVLVSTMYWEVELTPNISVK